MREAAVRPLEERVDAGLRPFRGRRMYSPRLWGYVLRYLWRFKVRGRHIRTEGVVFLSRRASVYCRRGLAHMELGRGIWIGRGSAVRCHEGFVRLGDDVVLGTGVAINVYLDVDIGNDCLFADRTYVADFDHWYEDPDVPIRLQGIAKSRVRIEPDCWVGEKATVLRGSTVGRGSVIGAHALVKGDIPPYSVAVGVPARVIKRRRPT